MEWLSPILVYHIVLLLTKVGGHHDYTNMPMLIVTTLNLTMNSARIYVDVLLNI
jgi:hypothetical protein